MGLCIVYESFGGDCSPRGRNTEVKPQLDRSHFDNFAATVGQATDLCMANDFTFRYALDKFLFCDLLTSHVNTASVSTALYIPCLDHRVPPEDPDEIRDKAELMDKGCA